MEPRPLNFVATACSGELLRGSPATTVSRICTDSRRVQPGDLFFALPGERFDGHDFVSEAVRQGVAAVVIEREPGRPAGSQPGPEGWGQCAIIAVENTRKALGRLAAKYRMDFILPIVAVGGSNGKTTTKELVAGVLRQKLATLWSEASYNNDIGVPLTLLGLEGRHQAAVVEAGTNHPGELEPLLSMIRPQLGVITSIGREHLEFFGDLAGVAQEEGTLAEALPVGGKLFLSGDSEWAGPIMRRTQAAVLRIGTGEANEWRAHHIRPDPAGVTFMAQGPHPGLSGEYRVGLLGRHQAVNALFAVAVGAELGLSRAELEHGLRQCQPAKMRLELWEQNGVRVLDDTYNANADSMVVALQTLLDLPCPGRRVAVLGDMAELGAQSEAAHVEVGRRAAELGVSQLFAVGKMAAAMSRGARDAGLSRVLEFGEVEAAGPAVKQFIRSGDVVLLKASRATRLERIGELLRAVNPAKKTGKIAVTK